MRIGDTSRLDVQRPVKRPVFSEFLPFKQAVKRPLGRGANVGLEEPGSRDQRQHPNPCSSLGYSFFSINMRRIGPLRRSLFARPRQVLNCRSKTKGRRSPTNSLSCCFSSRTRLSASRISKPVHSQRKKESHARAYAMRRSCNGIAFCFICSISSAVSGLPNQSA